VWKVSFVSWISLGWAVLGKKLEKKLGKQDRKLERLDRKMGRLDRKLGKVR
jgi:hypothetical protein